MKKKFKIYFELEVNTRSKESFISKQIKNAVENKFVEAKVSSIQIIPENAILSKDLGPEMPDDPRELHN